MSNAETIIDGWLHTGDVVRIDEAGRVHVVDRMKDLINRGGEKISSVEVEAVLAAAPGVAEAAVVAVPDVVMGEKVGAVLFAGGAPIDIDEVLAHCRKHLADFKVPQYAAVLGEPLPRESERQAAQEPTAPPGAVGRATALAMRGGYAGAQVGVGCA